MVAANSPHTSSTFQHHQVMGLTVEIELAQVQLDSGWCNTLACICLRSCSSCTIQGHWPAAPGVTPGGAWQQLQEPSAPFPGRVLWCFELCCTLCMQHAARTCMPSKLRVDVAHVCFCAPHIATGCTLQSLPEAQAQCLASACATGFTEVRLVVVPWSCRIWPLVGDQVAVQTGGYSYSTFRPCGPALQLCIGSGWIRFPLFHPFNNSPLTVVQRTRASQMVVITRLNDCVREVNVQAKHMVAGHSW